jgi:hypothetical protein
MDRQIKVQTVKIFTASVLKSQLVGFINDPHCPDEALAEMASVMMKGGHSASTPVPSAPKKKYGKKFPLNNKRWTTADDEYLKKNWLSEGCGASFNEIAKNNDAVRKRLGRTMSSMYSRVYNLKQETAKAQ